MAVAEDMAVTEYMLDILTTLVLRLKSIPDMAAKEETAAMEVRPVMFSFLVKQRSEVQAEAAAMEVTPATAYCHILT